MQRSWLIVNISAAARSVSLYKKKGIAGVEIPLFNVCIINSLSGVYSICKPRAKRHWQCIIRYFCAYHQSYRRTARYSRIVSSVQPSITSESRAALSRTRKIISLLHKVCVRKSLFEVEEDRWPRPLRETRPVPLGFNFQV